MTKTAVLIDGGYFLKRFPACYPTRNRSDAAQVARTAFQMATAHLQESIGKGDRATVLRHDLYRIFFYDCPPLTKKAQFPVSRRSIDFSRHDVAIFRTALHEELKRLRKTALRLGHLSENGEWKLREGRLKDLLGGGSKFAELTDDDFAYDAPQKGVDMRIGIDIASLAYKKQVNQIVLVAGDADFVPAAKLARREGIDFILDPMWKGVHASLHEHVDGIRSTCPRPVPSDPGAPVRFEQFQKEEQL